MAFVELAKVRSPEGMKRYLSKERSSPSVEANPEGVTMEMVKEIEAEHARFPRKNLKVLSRTLTQSWSPSESTLYSPEKYNQMGRELAARWAPGHLAWVTTHTDKDHIHNHIVICTVNSKTGKILPTKRKDILRLHQVSNDICSENGLSEMGRRTREPDVNMPKKVRQMVERGRKSWYADLLQKADFARAATTSFDEYVGVLHELGVQVRVENKNVSYTYGDKNPIRGKTLGKNFGNEGLMKAFEENDAKFAKIPNLRAQLRGDIRSVFDQKGNRLGTPSDLLLESASFRGNGKKDYRKFTKLDRRESRTELPPIFDERGGPLYTELKKTRGLSILDYCRDHKIKTELNKEGKTVLKGRSFVVIDGDTWTNTKNGQKGSIIQFVAIHDETNYVRALAKINNNPRLLLLEKAMGDYKRGYQSFYIPKAKEAEKAAANSAFSRLLNSHSVSPKAKDALLKTGRVHLGLNGSIWFEGEQKESALEMRESPDGKWQSKRYGKDSGAFFEMLNRSKKLVVFSDPFEFAIFQATATNHAHRDSNILVLFGDNESERRVDEILALHSHITEVFVAQSVKAERAERDKGMFHEMKQRLDPFSIEIKPLHLGDLGKARGRGPDISI